MAADNSAHEYRGFRFPNEEACPPDHLWYQMDFAGTETWDLTREGMLHAAREVGLESVQSCVAEAGTVDGILYASAEAEVVVGGLTFTAVGGADETSQQVRDPEHVFTVAETRAIKRAIRMAVPIVPIEQERVENDSPTPTNKPDDAPDAPPSEWDDAGSSEELVASDPQTAGSDGDLDW